MKVLVIDNNIEAQSYGAGQLRRLSALVPGATFIVRRAPDDDLPRDPSRFDKIIVSGSATPAMAEAPWISHLEDFIRSSLAKSQPLLGVCYGHQVLARVLGGKAAVGKSATPEFGWTRIELLGESGFTKGLPREFYSFSSHFDEVSRLPQSARLIARSAGCGIQAFDLPGKPVFAIQFHPEKSVDEGEQILIERKKKGLPRELLHPGQGKKYYDSKVGELIFGNFLKL